MRVDLLQTVLLCLLSCCSVWGDSLDDEDGCFYEEEADVKWSECYPNKTEVLKRELVGGESYCESVKITTRPCGGGGAEEQTVATPGGEEAEDIKGDNSEKEPEMILGEDSEKELPVDEETEETKGENSEKEPEMIKGDNSEWEPAVKEEPMETKPGKKASVFRAAAVAGKDRLASRVGTDWRASSPNAFGQRENDEDIVINVQTCKLKNGPFGRKVPYFKNTCLPLYNELKRKDPSSIGIKVKGFASMGFVCHRLLSKCARIAPKRKDYLKAVAAQRQAGGGGQWMSQGARGGFHGFDGFGGPGHGGMFHDHHGRGGRHPHRPHGPRGRGAWDVRGRDPHRRDHPHPGRRHGGRRRAMNLVQWG